MVVPFTAWRTSATVGNFGFLRALPLIVVVDDGTVVVVAVGGVVDFVEDAVDVVSAVSVAVSVLSAFRFLLREGGVLREGRVLPPPAFARCGGAASATFLAAATASVILAAATAFERGVFRGRLFGSVR